MPLAAVLSVTMGAAAPDTLYAAVAGDGLWRSEDAGESWAFVMDRPYLDGTEQDVLSLISVGSPSGMGGIWLYAGTDVGLTRVPDCFCRWQDVTAGDAMDAIVAGETSASTAPFPPSSPVRNLGVANAAPSQIYAGSTTGLWASSDAGVNWSLVSPTVVTALAVDPQDPLHLVAARTDGIAESRDGGQTWSPLTFTQEN
ncbi:WD40/YVTN/BNR-like repeat-containing protein [Loktanella sp. DJP18]|uniref:WD40/YVTN/BNR-like repeat-containing protein n=1 Tax=Loktanella sp. DJP18 TaxID=3409788 RepID=UPI003BB6F2C0